MLVACDNTVYNISMPDDNEKINRLLTHVSGVPDCYYGGIST